MAEQIYDLIVIGGGPAGYTAALRAAQLGSSVIVVEERHGIGGVCLYEGCIPSKTLLESSHLFATARKEASLHGINFGSIALDLPAMMKRKNEVVKKLSDGLSALFKKYKVIHVSGTGSPSAKHSEGVQTVQVKSPESPVIPRLFQCRKILLATGSEPVQLPGIPFDDDIVVNSKNALSFENVPEQLLVVGGGYIGIELATVWNRLGSRVTVVEALGMILPNLDSQLADTVHKSMKKQGVTFLLSTTVTRIGKKDGRATVTLSSKEGEKELSFDKVLVAVGRKAQTAALELDKLNIELNEKGKIKVDNNFQTTFEGIYAIGDLIDGPMLAHKGMEEGRAFAEKIAGKEAVVEYSLIPSIVYCDPEAASIGYSEQELKTMGRTYNTGSFHFSSNGRALSENRGEGFAKVFSDASKGTILGVHIAGAGASEIIATAAAVMSFGGSVEDISMIITAHPTLSEVLREAALNGIKKSVHS